MGLELSHLPHREILLKFYDAKYRVIYFYILTTYDTVYNIFLHLTDKCDAIHPYVLVTTIIIIYNFFICKSGSNSEKCKSI